MQLKVPSEILQDSPDPQRARGFLDALQNSSVARLLRQLSAAQLRVLVAVLGGSGWAGNLLVAHPEWAPPLLEPQEFPRRDEGLRHEVHHWLDPLLEAEDYEEGWEGLRRFRLRETLRVATRDLARQGTMSEIMRELSDVADACLEAAWRLCWRTLSRRMGLPWHRDAAEEWRPTQGCLVALGKLGGQELDYSGEIEVLFIYEEEGHLFKSPPRAYEESGKGQHSRKFFARLAEMMTAELGRAADGGILYRLRGPAEAGASVRSLAAYENDYAQRGQAADRMRLIKARPVAGDLALGAEFINTLQSFRYPQSLSPRMLHEMAEAKARLADAPAAKGEAERNLERGRGGLREIEFITQALQLLHAGRAPFLRTPSTLDALLRLVKYSFLPAADAGELEDAYVFLRETEHRLQLNEGQPAFVIPTERRARERLAKLMGAASLSEFEASHASFTGEVRRIFDQFLAGEEPVARTAALPSSDLGESREQWKEWLGRLGFRDPERALPELDQFLNGAGRARLSPATREIARKIVGRILELAPRATPLPPPGRTLSDPDRVLAQLGTFVDRYGARATLYEMWAQHPAWLEVLLLLMDRSNYLAELALRMPELVDELHVAERLNRQKSAPEILAELRRGAAEPDQGRRWRRYYEAEVLRLGLRDILGWAEFEQTLDGLSCLVEAGVHCALEQPSGETPAFCVIALDELAGRELNYGTIPELLLVTQKENDLAACRPIAARLREWLGTEPKAVALESCQDYYQARAPLAEVLALTRLRPMAGDPGLGRQFQQLAALVTDFRGGKKPGWKEDMGRRREEAVRACAAAGQNALDITTGAGGLKDVEFLAQAICLENGWQEPRVVAVLRRGREAGLAGCAAADRLLENYCGLRRIEGTLRRWGLEPETVLPLETDAFRRVAVRCGFRTPGEFAHAVLAMRAEIHAAWLKYFGPRDNIN